MLYYPFSGTLFIDNRSVWQLAYNSIYKDGIKQPDLLIFSSVDAPKELKVPTVIIKKEGKGYIGLLDDVGVGFSLSKENLLIDIIAN